MTLLVGGTNDGERFECDLLNVRFLKKHPACSVLDSPPMVIEHEFYRKERFSGCSKTFDIYVHESIDTDEVIERLINGYNPIKAAAIANAQPQGE